MVRNTYACRCGQEWDGEDDHGTPDDCPACGAIGILPHSVPLLSSADDDVGGLAREPLDEDVGSRGNEHDATYFIPEDVD